MKRRERSVFKLTYSAISCYTKCSLQIESTSSGCCVRNDRSGCVQTTSDVCSPTLSTFHKKQDGPGPVCGHDPALCGHDHGLWPALCSSRSLSTRNNTLGLPAHLDCHVMARPCCVGVHGSCQMRSREFCSFVGGTFHPEATLCSQVDCMQVWKTWVSVSRDSRLKPCDLKCYRMSAAFCLSPVGTTPTSCTAWSSPSS